MGRFNYNLRISCLKDVQLFRHEVNDELCVITVSSLALFSDTFQAEKES